MEQREEVAEILTAWSRVRPDLDLSPLAVFSRLGRVAKHFAKLRAAAFAAAGLESWEFDVLAVLRRAGFPHRVSIKVLVQETMVTSGTMTNRLDRLCERDLVQRVQDPNDGRGVLVEITAQGIERVDLALSDLVAAEAAQLAALTPAERKRLATLLTKLSGSFTAK